VTLLESDALVVRTVEVGECDVVATLVTERFGKLAVVVRGARKGTKRIGGALEPVHTVNVLIEDKGKELSTLKESRIVRVRASVVEDLDALDAAGVALRWARHLFPARHREPEGWVVLTELLDVLDARPAEASGPSWSRKHLAQAGFAMLSAVGYGIDLQRCVVCSRPCPEGKPAFIDPARGGLVCRSCGGAAQLMPAAARAAARALMEGRIHEVTDAHAEALLTIVDRAMAAHAGFER
jgi:DNA repair protein RecO (recombination protein O)